MIHIPKSEYSRRRKALMAQMEPNSIAILPAAAVAIRNRDVEHVYRQDSDFQYLSGFPEPQAVIVLMPGREHGEYILFCRERNAERELWDGLRAGQEGAIRDFGADDAFPITDIDDILPGLIEGRDRVYSAMGSNPEFDRHLMEWINVIRSKAHLGAQPPNEYVALDHLLHDMRLYKSAAEVKVMREAARISAQAHIRAMQASRAGLHEFSLEAELDYEFRKGGAKMPAYGSIVAAGQRQVFSGAESDLRVGAGVARSRIRRNRPEQTLESGARSHGPGDYLRSGEVGPVAGRRRRVDRQRSL
jgi:Xaa-Pro aminopeptidase